MFFSYFQTVSLNVFDACVIISLFSVFMPFKCHADYLGYGTDLVTPIIRRYETLSTSRQELLQQLTSLTDELKTNQHHLDAVKQQHSTYKLVSHIHYYTQSLSQSSVQTRAHVFNIRNTLEHSVTS